MCMQIFHMVNIDVTAGVGIPPLDTQPMSCLQSLNALKAYNWTNNNVQQHHFEVDFWWHTTL